MKVIENDAHETIPKTNAQKMVRHFSLQQLAYPGIFFRGVQQIQLRTEDRENGDLGAVVRGSAQFANE
jgi:hypothetical protein